jgi:hypothetical protein
MSYIDPTPNRVLYDEDPNRGGVLTLSLAGGANNANMTYDSLTSVDTTDAAFTASGNGPSTLSITTDADNFTVGTLYYIWDATSYHWESFTVASIDSDNDNIVTMPYDGLQKNYVSGSIISSTPPLFDVYKIQFELTHTAANQRAFIMLCDADPSSLDADATYADWSTDMIAHAANWSAFVFEDDPAGAHSYLHEEFIVPDRTASSRYLAVVTQIDTGTAGAGKIMLHRLSTASADVAESFDGP